MCELFNQHVSCKLLLFYTCVPVLVLCASLILVLSITHRACSVCIPTPFPAPASLPLPMSATLWLNLALYLLRFQRSVFQVCVVLTRAAAEIPRFRCFLSGGGWIEPERLSFLFFNFVYTAASIDRDPEWTHCETLIGATLGGCGRTLVEEKIDVPFL